jgi:hypothetical protein
MQLKAENAVKHIKDFNLEGLKGIKLEPDGIFITVKSVKPRDAERLRKQISDALSERHLLVPKGDKQITVARQPRKGMFSRADLTQINISVSALNADELAFPQLHIAEHAATIKAGIGAITSFTPDKAALVATVAALLGTSPEDATVELNRLVREVERSPDQRNELRLLTEALQQKDAKAR